MAAKLPAAQKRMFKNIFVCKSCSQKMRSEPLKIVQGQIACRRCEGHSFRPIRSKKK
ncbi:MAG TPA: hypothetical protein VJK07_02420 [Candidatus Nanoarchaeia archaeon]|nr:hypothetical protein [Candidatus Nanoarchaeia archaeon]